MVWKAGKALTDDIIHAQREMESSNLACASAGEGSACSAGDLGLIPGSGRSPGEGTGSPLQCSGLENPTDSVVHGVTKSRTRRSDFHSLQAPTAPGRVGEGSFGLRTLCPDWC